MTNSHVASANDLYLQSHTTLGLHFREENSALPEGRDKSLK